MKLSGYQKYITVLGIFTLVMMLWVVELPDQFDWTPTYSHTSDQPFGGQVMDSVLSRSMPGQYRCVQGSVEHGISLYRHQKDVALLYIYNDQEWQNRQDDEERLFKAVKKGATVILASTSYRLSQLGADRFSGEYSAGFVLKDFRKWHTQHPHQIRTEVLMCDEKGQDTSNKYQVVTSMIEDGYTVDSTFQVIAVAKLAKKQGSTHRYRAPIVVRRKYGKGTLILCSAPLLFTNYTMLDGNNAELIARILASVGTKRIVRIDPTPTDDAQVMAQQHPLHIIFDHAPLNSAYYWGIVVIILLMFFTARRRQRVIPIIHPAKNHSLEFVKIVGSLYFHQHKHADLVRTKLSFFVEELQRQIHIDIMDTHQDAHHLQVLAQATGMSYEDLEKLVRELRFVYHLDGEIEVKQMCELIQAMNNVLEKINN